MRPILVGFLHRRYADVRSSVLFLQLLRESIMFRPNLRKRPGTSLIEVLVVVAIMATLMSMLMGGVFRAQETARRLEAANHLRQIGFAMHMAAASNQSVLPTEKTGQGEPESFYVQIADHIDGGVKVPAAGEQAPSVRLFLNPSRRSTQQAPGRRDFGYATAGGNAILETQGGASLVTIAAMSGTESTALLTTLWMDPRHYTSGADATDKGWHTPNNSRSTAQPYQDRDAQGSTFSLGSPHAGGMPVLFASGRIANVPYRFAGWSQIWDTTKTAPANVP